MVLGLGNPGEEFSGTYHNVGFDVVERLAVETGVRIRQRCGPALISDRIFLGDDAAVLVEPQTYMNRSGAVLPALFERFETNAESLIVVYDDVALPLGKVRVRGKGSAGGHNGIKSLISSAGTDEFMRVRVGILPERPIEGVRDFVLSRVAKGDRELLDRAEETAANAVRTLMADGIEKTMAVYNGIDLRLSKEE
jgi:PTH1 family peptidyl-tRNA hydrolase